MDDEISLREILEFDLRRRGYEVYTAQNGREGLEKLDRTSAALVLSDVRMPEMDGVEFLREVRKRSFNSPVFIFVTAFTDISDEDAYQLGADAVFPKPFDRKKLYGRIERLVKPLGERWTMPPADSAAAPLIQSQTAKAGRAGLFIPLTQDPPAANSSVRFEVIAEGIPMRGTGEVRWARGGKTGDRGIGVEMTALEESSRAAFIQWVERVRPVPSIPNGR